MATEPDDRAKDMMRGMLGLKLFVVLFEGSGEDITPHLADHFDYLFGLEKEGKLFASGPYGDGKPGDSLTILRVDTAREAETVASANPFVARTGQTFTIRPWTMNEGAIRLTVHASSSSVAMT